MAAGILDKSRYFLGALAEFPLVDTRCPSCGGARSHLVRRKALVTALWECEDCRLRFRVPKERVQESTEFYQRRYAEGFTTDCPGDDELNRLVQVGFRGTPRDYEQYIRVLNAVGLRRGDLVLDFGCSWGYGSWQLRRAGFRVYSYDISKPRSAFAAAKLGCHVLADVAELPEHVDCLFTAHVIEHMPDPNVLWQAALRCLNPTGIVVCFAPNGEPCLERKYGRKRYHQLWGRVHPLLLTVHALRTMSLRHGFIPIIFSSPYSLEGIQRRAPDVGADGEELLLLACRESSQSGGAIASWETSFR